MGNEIKYPKQLNDLVKHGSLFEIQAFQRKQALAVATKSNPKPAIYVHRKASVKESIEREFKNKRFSR